MATKMNNTQSVVPTEATKLIKNYSVQGLFIILKTPEGVIHKWLQPKESVRVPESQVSQQIKNLHKRRIVSLSN